MRIAEYYELGTELGRGGMGIVYQGTDTRTSEVVAIKSLKNEVIEMDPGQVDRFIREGEVLRKLNHPNIVKMLTATQADSCYYLVMEFVEGGSLHDLLVQNPRLSVQRVLYIALDLADALTRAHRLNILHRDIKPANILLAADGTPRLTDFGMARVEEGTDTQEGALVGTLSYLAPESFLGDAPDERTDIWAFGIVIYEMLAGQRPFNGSSAGELINAILTQPIPPLEDLRPDIPTALLDLVNRMLARDRHARIPSVRMVGAELEAIIRGGENSGIQYLRAADSTGRFDTDEFTPIVKPTITQTMRAVSKLPAQPTQFIGRGDELNSVRRLLNQVDIRLVTLLGPGGIGKTRLGLAAVEEQLGNYEDGVFFVPLAPLEHVEFFIPAIAEALDFDFAGSSAPAEELLDYLSEKSMLLLMDNFEHIIEAAQFVAEILQKAPGIKILATSRERLRIQGEQIFEVDGMALPTSTQLEHVLEYSSVKLFAQSARRVAPEFEVTQDNAAQVAHILSLVQGLPLGIELAAAWLEALSIDEIIREIEQNLDFLETDLRDVPARHRSLRAVFEYSWKLLSEDEREVFMKLSVFRGGFEREAAQTIAGASLRMLTNMVNKSLVQRDPNGRYHLHKVLKQYSSEAFVNHPDFETVHTTHTRYYGELLKRIEPIFDTRREKAAIEQVETELENIRAAITYAISQRMWPEIGAIKQAVLLFYISSSMIMEGIEIFSAVATSLQTDNDPQAEDLFWCMRSREAALLTRVADYDRAWEYSSQAQAYFASQNNPREIARALNQMAYVKMMWGEFEESIQHAVGAQEILETQKAQNTSDWFTATGHRAYAEYLRGNLQAAYDIQSKIVHATDNSTEYSLMGRGYALNNLGETLRSMGKLKEARKLFQEAYDIFESYKLARGMAFTLNNLGGVLQTQGRYDEAKNMYQTAYRLNREIGDKSGIGHSLSALGNLAAYTGNFEEAKASFEQSLALRRSLMDRRGEAESLNDLARVSWPLGQFDTAQRYFNEAIEISRSIGDQTTLAFALNGRGQIHALTGNTAEARRDLNQGLKLAQEIRNGFATAQARGGLAMLALEAGDYDSLRHYNREVLTTAVQAHAIPMIHVGVAASAFVKAKEGDTLGALELIGCIENEHSIVLNVIRKKIQELRAQLEQKVSQSDAAAARQRGLQADLLGLAQNLIG